MSESKWIEHYRAGAWTVGEVIEAGAAWIVAMDPDHYRLRFFPHRDAETFTVGIDAEWTDEQPGELANYTPSYESGSSDCQPGEVTISDDGLLSVMPRQRSAFHVVIRTGWTAQGKPCMAHQPSELEEMLQDLDTAQNTE